MGVKLDASSSAFRVCDVLVGAVFVRGAVGSMLSLTLTDAGCGSALGYRVRIAREASSWRWSLGLVDWIWTFRRENTSLFVSVEDTLVGAV